MLITDAYEIDLFTDQRLVIDKSDHDHNVIENAEQLLSNAPRAFTANRGQLVNDDVLFYDQGGAVWFSADGVWFELREYTESKGQGSDLPAKNRIFEDNIMSENPIHSKPSRPDPLLPDSQGGVRDRDLGFGNWDSELTTNNYELTTSEYRRVILKQEFIGANNVIPKGRERLGWNSNFFYGNNSSNWCTNVPNFSEIWFENLYDGIDLKYYTNEKGLKYNFIVHPGANPNKIRLRYQGAKNLAINNFCDLIIATEIEDIINGNLFIYQESAGIKHQVNGIFNLFDNFEYGFEITSDYNQKKILIIDPLIYSTYIGGNNNEGGVGMTLDNHNNVFLTGQTSSLNFPNTTGAFDQTFHTPNDAFILKLNRNGSKLYFSTFFLDI